jgi:hypothetical protein
MTRHTPEALVCLDEIRRSIAYLKNARDRLRYAGAKRAAAYVARALKSAQGAERHAMRGDVMAGRVARR